MVGYVTKVRRIRRDRRIELVIDGDDPLGGRAVRASRVTGAGPPAFRAELWGRSTHCQEPRSSLGAATARRHTYGERRPSIAHRSEQSDPVRFDALEAITPDTSLRPSLAGTIAFGTAFTLGWLLN